MHYWIAIAACAGCLVIGHTVGKQMGLRQAPETVAYQADRDAYFDRQFEQILAEPSRREQVCHQIFELVEGELSLEHLDIQADLTAD